MTTTPASGSSQRPKLQTKLAIPFPDDARSGGLDIVGILAHAEPLGALHAPSTLRFRSEAPSSSSSAATPSSAPDSRQRQAPKSIALILHGVLAHKDQIYHKKLAAALDMDSFRFDFRANHETPGEWDMSSFHEDVRDLRTVIAHLRRYFNYRVDLIVAHSRGALDTWTYLGEQARRRREVGRAGGRDSEELEVPPFVVALGSRWRMEKIYDRLKDYEEGFKKEGFHRWRARVAGEEVEVRITPEQVEAFARYPVADYVRDAPLETDYLLITGTADKVVPTSDVGYYLNALTAQPGRKPGWVQVHLVEHADHNFVGFYDEVVGTIVRWLQSRNASSASTLNPLANTQGHVDGTSSTSTSDRDTASSKSSGKL